jgi:DNA-directed RNA polymerase subunit RPC12/RpoP
MDKVRCVNCRTEVNVPSDYAHGDHIKCGTCGTKHKVQRGDVLRLVLADVTPLRDALRANQSAVERLEDELQGARRSFGIGANGLGIAVIYLLVQVALNNQEWSSGLLWEGVGVGIATGLGLELANYLFLAKRQKLTRLSEEIQSARAEGREIQRKIREAGGH